ncbi:MAG: hypothetical protein KJ622_01135 [Alphaproteobacteria bacterium]|nr:hypothetical protein [Alphaproteobacteria bacterium]
MARLDDCASMPDSQHPNPRLRRYRVVLELAQRPLFCCCCIALTGEDAKRLKRVLALTRAIKKSWR